MSKAFCWGDFTSFSSLALLELAETESLLFEIASLAPILVEIAEAESLLFEIAKTSILTDLELYNA